LCRWITLPAHVMAEDPGSVDNGVLQQRQVGIA
jgi:hypothetical protein